MTTRRKERGQLAGTGVETLGEDGGEGGREPDNGVAVASLLALPGIYVRML